MVNSATLLLSYLERRYLAVQYNARLEKRFILKMLGLHYQNMEQYVRHVC